MYSYVVKSEPKNKTKNFKRKILKKFFVFFMRSDMDWISSVVVDSNGTIGNGTSRTFSAVDYPVFMFITWRVTKTINISATGTYLYKQTSVVNANGRLTPAYFIWLDSGATITISNNRTGPSSYDEVDFITYKWDS